MTNIHTKRQAITALLGEQEGGLRRLGQEVLCKVAGCGHPLPATSSRPPPPAGALSGPAAGGCGVQAAGGGAGRLQDTGGRAAAGEEGGVVNTIPN